jgi:predicted TIM-barrel fold metal-dependent hydrolase
MKVIDFHAHAFPEKIADRAVENLENHYQVTIPFGGRIGDLLHYANEAEIEHLVLCSAATKPEAVKVNNDWVAEIAHNHPGFITGFGSLHAGSVDFVEELDRMRALGLKGVKIHPDFQGFDIDDPRMWPIYEAIGDDLIVLFHVGDKIFDHSKPVRLAKVLQAFPKMKVVAAHLGGWSCWDEAKEFLLKKDIYIDTSSTFWCLSKEERVALMRFHGTDRVLFGTDYPIRSHKVELADFMTLPLNDKEKENILYYNARQLLGCC